MEHRNAFAPPCVSMCLRDSIAFALITSQIGHLNRLCVAGHGWAMSWFVLHLPHFSLTIWNGSRVSENVNLIGMRSRYLRRNFNSLRTIVHLMGTQVVEWREFDAACSANQLLVGQRGTLCVAGDIVGERWSWWAWFGFAIGRFVQISGRTIVFFVREIIFIFAKNNVAFFALGNTLFHEYLRLHVWVWRWGARCRWFAFDRQRWSLLGCMQRIIVGRNVQR